MRISVTPNPLARVVYNELQPILNSIDEVTGSLEIEPCRSAGVESVEGGEFLEVRKSTDDECHRVTFSISLSVECDARESIPSQLICWLRQVATKADIARVGIQGLEERHTTRWRAGSV
jgi:hypothetical protein